MKAIRFSEYGQPEVLHISEIEAPPPKQGEVLIKVLAAAINPSDVKNVAGVFSAPLPRIPGRDFAGVVVSEGAWQGVEVWGSGAGFGILRDGAHSEYICVPTTWLSAKPASLTMAQAATVGVPYVTAWTALMRIGKLQTGETLLITGATGAVGNAAIQIAHWHGAQVIGVGVSDEPSEADHYLNARKHRIPDGVKELTHGKGADIALDAVGGLSFEPSLQSLRVGGRQIAISSTATPRVEFDLTNFYHQSLSLIGVDTMKLTGPEIANILDELRPGFDEHLLRPKELSQWPLEQAVAAYIAASTGHAKKKQVLVFE